MISHSTSRRSTALSSTVVLLLTTLFFGLMANCPRCFCSAASYYFEEYQFRQSVQKAMEEVQSILNTTRHPILVEDAPDHTYEDKFTAVEMMTNTAMYATIDLFQRLGLTITQDMLDEVQTNHKTIQVQFQLDRQCTFQKQTQRQVVVSETQVDKTYSATTSGRRNMNEKEEDIDMDYGSATTQKKKIKQTVYEYHWTLTAPYSFSVVLGGDEHSFEFLSGSNNKERSSTITVSGNSYQRPPAPTTNHTYSNIKLDLTWLIQQLSFDQTEI